MAAWGQLRFILPVLAAFITVRSAISLLFYRTDDEVWGTLLAPDGTALPVVHWENILGRSHSCDLRITDGSVAKNHAALIRDEEGNWILYDLAGKNRTKLRGRNVQEPVRVRAGDSITLGNAVCLYYPKTQREEQMEAEDRAADLGSLGQILALISLSLFMALLAILLMDSLDTDQAPAVVFAYVSLGSLMWASYFITRALDRRSFELETLAFLLTAIGFSCCLSSDPGKIYTQTISLAAGLLLYWVLGWFLRHLELSKLLRWPAAAIGLLLLGYNLLSAGSLLGARNWVSIGSVSFQPSELVKIAFVLSGAATLDRLFARRNLILFVANAAVCVICLALMGDFGTALVFFAAYLVTAFMRSGSFAAILLSSAGAGLAAFLAVLAKPYITARFATWGHAWEVPYDGGFQQVRTMTAAASGGFFGLGPGCGWFKDVFASDTDMVFGLIAEELGLLLAVLCVLCIVIYALFAIRSVQRARSTFYVIAACTAASIMAFQLILNVFGSLDILPFTGVTFPFVSKGGTSLMASWGLLAFLKAGDTRTGASFAVRAAGFRKKQRRKENRRETYEKA